MTTPTSETRLSDTPTSLGDAVDYDAWFDSPWGRHAYAIESTEITRAAGTVGHCRVLDAGCGEVAAL